MRVFFSLIAAIFGSLSLASQTTIALIPLDSRPINATMPINIAKLANINVVSPDINLLGRVSKASNIEEIYDWLEKQSVDGAIISLDGLLYGGLVQSRTSKASEKEITARFDRFLAWQERSKIPVWAFITIPRYPDAIDRQRNFNIIESVIKKAEQSVFKKLFITWDDAKTGSPATYEADKLKKIVFEHGLADKVFIHPGADEATTELIATMIIDKSGVKPKVFVRYSNNFLIDQSIAYDGQSLSKSVDDHINSVGLLKVNDLRSADFVLYIYNGFNKDEKFIIKPPERTFALEILQISRSKPVALADVERVNLPNRLLTQDLVKAGGFFSLLSFSAWGTPSNNIGLAVSQASLQTLSLFKDRENSYLDSKSLLLNQYINDYLYNSDIRFWIRKNISEKDLVLPNSSSVLLENLKKELQKSLNWENRWQIVSAGFPWDRSFEIKFELTFNQNNVCSRKSACPEP